MLNFVFSCIKICFSKLHNLQGFMYLTCICLTFFDDLAIFRRCPLSSAVVRAVNVSAFWFVLNFGQNHLKKLFSVFRSLTAHPVTLVFNFSGTSSAGSRLTPSLLSSSHKNTSSSSRPVVGAETFSCRPTSSPLETTVVSSLFGRDGQAFWPVKKAFVVRNRVVELAS